MRNFKHVTNPCDKKVLPIITFARQSGMTWAAIAEELNIQGHPTPAMFRKKYKQRGQSKGWEKSQVYRIARRHGIK